MFILFSADGHFKTIASVKDHLGETDGNFVVEVDDGFEFEGFRITYENGQVIKEVLDTSGLPTLEDVNMQNLRNARDLRLVECDWTQLPDVPEEVSLAWMSYRQALRDVTDNYSSLEDVVWPTKP
jgi:hypothetical protein